MYRNVVVFAAGALALAVFAPSLFTEWTDASPDPGPSSSPPAADDAQVPQAPPRESGYRQAVLAADARGQYAADTLVNGAPVRMLVDTGASVVVLSAETARRLGLAGDAGKWTVKTASGMLDAAPVRLRNVSLGGLYMNDVQAVILPPNAGDANLLGASFLKRLISVEQRNGTLVLRQ